MKNYTIETDHGISEHKSESVEAAVKANLKLADAEGLSFELEEMNSYETLVTFDGSFEWLVHCKEDFSETMKNR